MSHCRCVGRKAVGDERERGKERSHLSWLAKKESLRKSSWSSGVSAVFEGWTRFFKIKNGRKSILDRGPKIKLGTRGVD